MSDSPQNGMREVREASTTIYLRDGSHLYVGPRVSNQAGTAEYYAPYCEFQQNGVPPDPVKMTLREAAEQAAGQEGELSEAAAKLFVEVARTLRTFVVQGQEWQKVRDEFVNLCFDSGDLATAVEQRTAGASHRNAFHLA